jgi:RNA polymerase sigma-70 factor (ECF subfamily)
VQLITANHDHLRRYIYTLLPHEQDAQDVMQEVCLTLSRKFTEYDRSRPFLPWACGFAYLKVLQHRDHNPRRTVLLPVEVLELLAREREAEEPVLAERLVALEKCLAKLGKLEPAVAQLREVENFFTDVAPEAALRTAYLYRDAGIKEKYVRSLRGVLKRYPKSGESSQAHQRLEEMGLPIGGGVDAEE